MTNKSIIKSKYMYLLYSVFIYSISVFRLKLWNKNCKSHPTPIPTQHS